MSNFQNIIYGRSIRDSHSFQHHQRQIENALEDSLLLDHNYAIEDLPLHDNVSSTISIAMSNDGQYYASTHGDHTVKVFDFHNNHREHRVFHGHPRTPWTVKFNPRNSNFVASGCLGFQVRLWSISDNACIGLLRLDAPIISLSFHPKGEYIAIASGQRLEIWHWTAQLAPSSSSNTRRYQGSPGQSSDLTQRPVHYMEKAVVHPRNMRATIFHPNGEYLFVAAPDTPRQQHSSLTYCSLFAIKFTSLLRGDDWLVDSEPSATTPTIDLTVFPTILSQIHLYSDGGIDISADGAFLLTCGRLKQAPAISNQYRHRNSNSKLKTSHHNASPMSTTDRHVVNGDVIDSLTGTGSVQPLSSMYVNSNINSNGGRARLFQHARSDLQRNDAGSDFVTLFSSTQNTPPPPPPNNGSGMGGLFDFLGTGNMVGGNFHNAKISLSDRDRAALDRSIDMQNDSIRRFNQFSRGMFGRQDDGVNGQEASGIPLSPPFMRDPQSSESSASSIADDSESGFGSNSGSRKHALSHSYLSKLTDGSDDSDDERRLTQATFAFRSIDLCQKQWASNQRPPDYSSSNRLPSVNCNQMAPFPLNVDVNDPEHAISSSNPDSFVCLYKLQFNTSSSGDIMPPTLHSCKKLEPNLLQAITSARLSSSCRYMMLGFGVRKDGLVVGHREPKAVCEIISLTDEEFNSVCTIADNEDEVNIAQFHPTPGFGIVYGTKRGKVRTVSRSS